MKANFVTIKPLPLLRYSPIYRELSKQNNDLLLKQQEELPLFFVLKDTISAKDAMKTIETFDFDKNFLNKKIVFLENTSGGHWDVVVKNEAGYKSKTIEVVRDGLCGLTSATLAMKELDMKPDYRSFATFENALSQNQNNQYTIAAKGEPKKYQTFANDGGLKLKIGNLLSDTKKENRLNSYEIQSIIEANNWDNAVKFNQPLERCFENNKKHEFHVRTLFCNYLSKNLPINDSLATLDLNNLILNDFGADVNKLKFNKSDKFDFKYLFPVDEGDLNKVKIFYRDMESGEKMISKVVKILDKYFKDLEGEKNIQKINIKTFGIVEKAIAKIIETKNKFGDDCQFPDKDYKKIVNFSEKYSKFKVDYIKKATKGLGSEAWPPYEDPPALKNDDWGLLKPFENFIKIFSNSGDDTDKAIPQNGKVSKSTESSDYPKHVEDNKKPSNFFQEIIDIFCCGSRNGKGGGR